jgi:uncharacterized protein YaaN involved in tellurite resistance
MFKKILFTFTIFSLLSCMAVPAMAQEITSDKEAIQEYLESKFETAKIAILKTLGKNMIQRRINVLTAAGNLLDQARLVADDVKQVLGDELDDTIASLGVLKGDIEGEENLELLKAKVESIVTKYRVYIVQLPKAHGLAVVSHYRTMSVKLDEIIEKLGDKIDELGYDSEDVNKLIDEAKDFISSASSNLDAAEDKLEQMEIDWPSQATTLNLEARGLILNAKGDLQDAFAKLKEAILEIKTAAEEEED